MFGCLHLFFVKTSDFLVVTRVVQIIQCYAVRPSKSSNGQPGQGLLQKIFDLKALTTSSFEMKFLDCPQPYLKVS